MTATNELRERASTLRQQAQSLEDLANEVENRLKDIDGGVVAVATPKRRGKTTAAPKAKTGTGKRGRPVGSGKTDGQPPLGKVVMEALAKYPNGAELKTIVDAVVASGYKSNSKSLSQNVSTTLYLLRINANEVKHDKKTRLYTLAKTA